MRLPRWFRARLRMRHPAWCADCQYNPFGPQEGNHHSRWSPGVGEIRLQLVTAGGDTIHLVWVAVWRRGRKRAESALTLRQARALQVELGRMLDAAGPEAWARDEARLTAARNSAVMS